MDDSKEADKQRRREYDQKWRDEHREQVRRYAREYYQDHYSIGAKDGTKERVSTIAADPSLLFLWVTWPLMPQWNSVVTAWGFKYKTIAFDWI